MKEYIDDLLKQLPNGNYKAYLSGHRAEFVDFLYDYENAPLYAFWRMAKVPDPTDEKTKKIVGLI